MLVGLPVKRIAEFWDIFQEVIRESVPTAPDMLPDRMQQMLFAAMTGRIQCWVMVLDDSPDEFYGACVTRVSVDDLSGQRTLLIYAIANFKPCPVEVRRKDFERMKAFAKEWGCSYLSAYTNSKAVAETVRRATGDNMITTYYLRIPTEEM